MAKLEDLRPSVYDLPDDEFDTFIALYRERRLVQLTEDQPIPTEPGVEKPKRKKREAIPNIRIMLTQEEKALASTMGIPFRTMLKLKQQADEQRGNDA